MRLPFSQRSQQWGWGKGETTAGSASLVTLYGSPHSGQAGLISGVLTLKPFNSGLLFHPYQICYHWASRSATQQE